MKQLRKFDAADYLDSDAVMAEYLNAALEDENPDVFLQALADVAKARGMTRVARKTGLGRESLYKALAPGAKPRRFFAINNNLGLLKWHFFPTGAGRDYVPSPYLEVLQEHRKDFTVFSGVSYPNVDGGHPADVCFITGAPHPGSGSFRNTISLDQFIAERIGIQTRFPSLTLSPWRFDRRQVREVTAFSFYLFMISVSARFGTNIDALVVGAYLGTSAVAVYMVAMKIAQYQWQLCGQASTLMFPVVVRFHASGNQTALRTTLVEGTRLAVGLVAGVSVCLIAFGGGLTWGSTIVTL